MQSAPALSSLCRAASNGTPLTSTPGHLDLDLLYLGHGGVRLDLETEDRPPVEPGPSSLPGLQRGEVPGGDDSTASPPSYDELDPSLPTSALPQQARKRPRTSSLTAATAGEPLKVSSAAEATSELRQLLKRAVETQASLSSVMDRPAESEERLKTRIAEVEAINAETEAENARLRQRLNHGELAAQAAGQADENRLLDYVDRRIGELRDELEDLMDVRIDDAKTDVKYDLQKEFDERFEQAVEDLKQAIQ